MMRYKKNDEIQKHGLESYYPSNVNAEEGDWMENGDEYTNDEQSNDLDALVGKISKLQREMNKMAEKMNLMKDHLEDLNQQVNILKKKKQKVCDNI